jgi:intracellular sulfur oxidation DsrE/DsrF family protein
MMTINRRRWLAIAGYGLALAGPFFLTLALTDMCSASPKVTADVKVRTHRIVFQVNSEDPATMKHAITNSLNAIKSYGEKNEPVAIEIVAYGPGVHMFRTDTSPVKDLLQFLHVNNPDVVFSVCGNTRTIMERAEGRPLSLVEGARVVPFGIVRLAELQEAGWSYIRP